ncbi:MAG: hypothetical protein BSR46_04165 [Candidatus Dactylopiibacterium carminicum]|nr:MAG: hypothetical protein BSR46_04165 [Candidatus Dactylopiibacterium carminicum]
MDELVIATFDDIQPLIRIPNKPAAIKRWLANLPVQCTLGMEATGTLHRTLADLAFSAGHRVYVFNPKDVAFYLKSLRVRGKTDLFDAAGIARYTHNESAQCHPYAPLSEDHLALTTLIQRRHQVVKQRASLSMSFSQGDASCLSALSTLMKAFEALIAQIDQRLQDLMAADAVMQRKCKLLMGIHGVGPLVSTTLALRMSRIHYANSDALVAAVGLDPRPRESGRYVGTRQLSKRGNPEERRLLYMAAISACRNTPWRTMRDALLSRGLPRTAIYCIIARKILRVAFAVWNSETPFDPTLIGQPRTQT